MVRLPRLVRIDGKEANKCKREKFIEFYLGQRVGAKSVLLKNKPVHIQSLFEQKWIQVVKMEEVRSAPPERARWGVGGEGWGED